jgi:hypothetical protein
VFTNKNGGIAVPEESPDDGLSRPKHVNLFINTFVCVPRNPPFLFVSTTNRVPNVKFVY